MRIKKGSIQIVLGVLLILSGILLAVYNLREEKEAAKASQEAVIQLDEIVTAEKEENVRDAETEVLLPDYILDPEMEMPTRLIDGWNYIGILEIPDLNLYLPIIDEWSYPALKIAPCRYEGTAYQKNMVIAAHNYQSHFARLHELDVGAEIYFSDMDGNRFSYLLAEQEVLPPTAVEEMCSDDWPLTLFTCTIDGQNRVTMRCEEK